MTEAPILLRVSEAARLLAVSRSKAYELAAAGLIPTLRVGRGIRVPRAALERWVEQHTDNMTGPVGHTEPAREERDDDTALQR